MFHKDMSILSHHTFLSHLRVLLQKLIVNLIQSGNTEQEYMYPILETQPGHSNNDNNIKM